MCGISAIFSPDSSANPTDLIKMTREVIHRGPDDGGFLFLNKLNNQTIFIRDTSGRCPEHKIISEHGMPHSISVGLGHRRLSIVDQSSSGVQPMRSSDDRFWIICNGEIYNHKELRSELELLGHSFLSTSDTEVLLAAYTTWGEKCLERLNGMFAFIIFDSKEQIAFCARDRFGVKPLYYWRNNYGTLYFASEIKQFTKLPDWDPRLNKKRAYDFLAWGLTDHTNETLFQGVLQVKPGHFIKFNTRLSEEFPNRDSNWQAEHVWYKLSSDTSISSLDKASSLLYEKLLASIKIRLQANMTIGANLSGGLDSSTIACLIDKVFKDGNSDSPFFTLSATFEHPEITERMYIDAASNAISAKPLFVTPEFNDLKLDFQRLTWHQDEPFASSSIFAEWSVYQTASSHGIKIMLGGQGADEQLAGYPEHIGHFYRGWIRNRQPFLLLHDLFGTFFVYRTSISSSIKLLLNSLLPQVLRQPLRNFIGTTNQKPTWLNTELLSVIPYDPYDSKGYRNASVSEASKIQLESTNLPMQLHWEDRNSMAHSIESRSPFLDYRVVEYLYGIPDNFRYSKGESKVILRRAISSIVPKLIASRKGKIGFSTPESIWVKEQGAYFFQDAIKLSIEQSCGIIKPTAGQYFLDMIEGKRTYNHSLWRVISFGAWIKTFQVKV